MGLMGWLRMELMGLAFMANAYNLQHFEITSNMIFLLDISMKFLPPQ